MAPILGVMPLLLSAKSKESITFDMRSFGSRRPPCKDIERPDVDEPTPAAKSHINDFDTPATVGGL
jgi:hypothetical protein